VLATLTETIHPHLPIYQAIILGITQGLTEFAPVSSSGHLILVPWLFKWSILNDAALNKTFDVALHLGTFVGAVFYFRQMIAELLRAFFRSLRRRRIDHLDERMAWFLVIGSIPGALIGAAFESTIEDKLGQPWLIAVMLAVFGVILYVVDRIAPQTKRMRDLTWPNVLIIGGAQAVALQPGVSRSGVTITAARALGMNREAATRFSFLLSLPIIGGAVLLKGAQLVQTGMPQGMAWPFFWGTLTSAVSGYIVIAWLLKYLRNHDFLFFMIYRLVVAAGVFVLIATGVRPATI
jgi:undecaprenyl-diphosphatase